MRASLIALAGSMLLACALGALGQTIYKYRGSDGRTVYSSQRFPGLELIETFEYRSPPPEAQRPGPAESARRAEERIRQHIEALNLAWADVRDAEAALAEAEARLRAGIEPLESESTSIAGPARSAPPAAGGPGAAAPPAVGGPMGTRRGGGRAPEYAERLGKLEADVSEARTRLERAIQRYNALR